MNRIEDTSKEFEPLLPTQDITLNHYQYGISKQILRIRYPLSYQHYKTQI